MATLDNIQQTFSSKILFILSATSFCCGVSLTVKCLSMPPSRHSCRKGSLVYSPPLSEWSTLIFLPVFSPCSSTPQTTLGLPLCAYGIYPTSPRVIIYKRLKVMVTSNRCHLGRSPDICVTIIQNLRFKDSAESETSQPSCIRLGPLRDESESRVGRLNSEEIDLAENRS